ncbi:hypothetical protein [Tomitella biformata]|uniref:hypothetical protein n=1 Tax=Tomitella biformata TaxID=630403 RepID=UPI000467BF2C|nr:hypothetical protein [Tomitella biformata]
MSVPDPLRARPRTDLPFLRRRAQPSAPAAGVPGTISDQEALTLFIAGKITRRLGVVAPVALATPAPTPRIDMSRPSRGGSRPTPPPTGARPQIDMSRPDRSRRQPAAASGLDLGAAPPTRTTTASSLDLDPPVRPAAPSSDLDLTPTAAAPRPPAPLPTPGTVSLDLDLDLDLSPGPSPTSPGLPAPAAPRPGPPPVRAESGRRVILTYAEPIVTLTRIQSGIGSLEMEGAWTQNDGGPVRLGCAYELRSGASSTVQLTGGRGTAPPGSRRPVIVARGGEFEGFGLDLRQCGELARLIVYAYSESGAPVDWTGTFITRTYGNARIEMPLAQVGPSSLAVLTSMYNIGGQLVMRAELEPMSGSVRDACQAFGFDKITWLDERTSID